MDTVEQLDGTYFYKGFANLSAHELLFWIMIDTVEEQLGVQDVLGVAALILGDNSIPLPGKPGTATPGTSHASLFFRKYLIEFYDLVATVHPKFEPPEQAED